MGDIDSDICIVGSPFYAELACLRVIRQRRYLRTTVAGKQICSCEWPGAYIYVGSVRIEHRNVEYATAVRALCDAKSTKYKHDHDGVSE